MAIQNPSIHWHVILGYVYVVAIGLAITLAVYIIIRCILQLLDYYRLFKQPKTFLEITPPANQDKTPLATEQFYAILHGLNATRALRDKWFMHKVVLSLEDASSRAQGIRYIVAVNPDDVASFKHSLLSYESDVQIQEVKDYTPEYVDQTGKQVKVLEFKLTGPSGYPLNTQTSLQQHDPIAYPTGSMTHLATGELMAMQLVISPTNVYEAHRLEKQIMANKNLQSLLKRFKRSSKLLWYITLVIRIPFWFIGGLFWALFEDHTTQKPTVIQVQPKPVITKSEREHINKIYGKVSQPLFRVSLRVLIVAEDKAGLKERTKAIKTSLTAYSVPKYQGLKAKMSFPSKLKQRYRLFAYKHRLPSMLAMNANVLSSSEVASIYHFPHSLTAKTENIVKSLSKTLPAPLSLKNGIKPDIILGANNHHGTITPIGLTEADRARHVFIIGGTGNGKTTMLQFATVQDIVQGKGVAVVDPHGDFAESLLRYIPEDRIKDVIYFDPDDLDYPIGMNLLELPEGLTGNNLQREKDLVTEAVISVFRKLFSEDGTGGHRIEHVLRNGIRTALTVKDATLFTVYDLLLDADYRRKVVDTLQEDDLIKFWEETIDKAGDYQEVKMTSGVTTKINRFQGSASAVQILGQPKSTINFEDIIDSSKILICNFSKGKLGEDTSTLFGTSIIAKLQLAAARRARQPEDERIPFYLYVDEFQNFATKSFEQVFSEARKYKLFLTLAEQSTSQQDNQQMINIILSNVGAIICFRTGSPLDERLLLPKFRPHIVEGEIANLDAYNFYMKILGVKALDPLSGETLLLGDKGSKDIADRVIASSRQHYTGSYTPPKPRKKKPKQTPKKRYYRKKGSSGRGGSSRPTDKKN
ncbi:MAG: TraM recognition domain-containing protein [Candidatus Saccharimonadales bacterium]